MQPLQLEIRGSGASWLVLANGIPVTDPRCPETIRQFRSYGQAEVALPAIVRQLNTTTRRCIHCARPFKSRGRGHRLCRTCDTLARGAIG